MLEAINELKKHNIDLSNLVSNFKKSHETKIVDTVLYYRTISEGLMCLVHYKHDEQITFTNNFNTFGTMLDVSRGAAFKVSYIKNLIRKQSLMGVNEIWLYMEDMYQLPEYPQFGYLRGSYSEEELKDIVTYANIFEIKIVPTIQTLGHMEQFLKWQKSSEFVDQENVLLTKSEQTFKLIDTMFKQLKKIFKHDKIHVGLDETWGFGFGNFYKKHGYVSQIDNFFDHLNEVNNLALKNGFKDVINWSDMPYRLLSSTNYYYDYNITLEQSIIDRIPENIKLAYWDYYNKDFNRVDKMLENHVKMTDKVVMASGTWIWTRLNYDKRQTDATAGVHIDAAIKNNVKELILTQWMDDGAYGDHETTLLGVYEMSLKANTTNTISNNVYKYITNELLDVSYNKTKINNLTMSQVGLLWDDPQFSLYLTNFVKNDLSNYKVHLKELESLLDLYKDDEIYEYEYNIIAANYYKVKGRYYLIKQYSNNEDIDVENLFNKQIESLENLNNIFRKKWYNNYKMNGFEVVQSRLATQIIRAKEMITLANLYNTNKISQIDGILDKAEVIDEFLSLKFGYIAYTTMPF